jgi:hypothetical protein
MGTLIFLSEIMLSKKGVEALLPITPQMRQNARTNELLRILADMTVHNGSQLLLPRNAFKPQFRAGKPSGVVAYPTTDQQPAIEGIHQKIPGVKAMAKFPWRAIELVVKGLTLGDREGHISGRGFQSWVGIGKPNSSETDVLESTDSAKRGSSCRR